MGLRGLQQNFMKDFFNLEVLVEGGLRRHVLRMVGLRGRKHWRRGWSGLDRICVISLLHSASPVSRSGLQGASPMMRDALFSRRTSLVDILRGMLHKTG